jgi:hypothetical protein
MNRIKENHLFLLLLLMLFLFSCGKKNDGMNPPISAVPEIELLHLSSQTIHALQDSIVFAIKYTDGDGDLGDYDADTLSLWITDNRFPLTEKFHIIPLAPAGTNIVITGELDVTMDHVILKDQTAASETATFTIKLKDRARNWSNEVTSSTVTILP